MFGEFHKKAKAVIKKVHNTNILNTQKSNIASLNKLEEKIHKTESHLSLLSSSPSTIECLPDTQSIKMFLVDPEFVKSIDLNFDVFYFYFFSLLMAYLLLHYNNMLAYGMMLGILISFTLFPLFVYVLFNADCDESMYVKTVSDFILKELEKRKLKVDNTNFPTLKEYLKSCFNGWVYVSSEFESKLLLSEMGLTMAHLSFEPMWVEICLSKPIIYGSKKKLGDYMFYRKYLISYNHLAINLEPESLNSKRVWNKKLPIKLSYTKGGISEEPMHLLQSVHQVIKDKAFSDPTGPTPNPNCKMYNSKFQTSAEEGAIYLFALTGREKELIYRNLDTFIHNKHKKLLDENCNIDPLIYSDKLSHIYFVSRIKEIIEKAKLNSDYDTPPPPPPLNQYPAQTRDSIENDEKLGDFRLSTVSSSAYLEVEPIEIQSCRKSYAGKQKHNNREKNRSNDGNFSNYENKIFDCMLSSKTVLTFNLMFFRLLWDFLKEDKWTEKIKVKMQNKINRFRLPSFIKSIELENLDIGDSIPSVCSNCDPVTDDSGGLWFYLPFSYTGKLSFTLDTQLNVSIYDELITKAYTESASKNKKDENSENLACDNKEDEFEVIDAVNEIEAIIQASSNLNSDTTTPTNLLNLDSELGYTDSANNNINSEFTPRDENLEKDYAVETDSNTTNKFSNFGKFKSEPNLKETLHQCSGSYNNSSMEETEKNDPIDSLLNTKSGQKIYSVVGKLAQSKIVKKLGRSRIVQNVYNAAKNKLSKLHVKLTVNIKSIKGILVINIPPPPTDRIWFGFKTPPAIRISSIPKVNSKNVKLPKLTHFIDSKLVSEFNDVLVLPNMEDIDLSIMTPLYTPHNS